MIITEIQDLKDWQTDRDETLILGYVDAVERVHPGIDLSLRALKLVGLKDDGVCEFCGAGMLEVRDDSNGTVYLMCRNCINAVRRQSHHHRQYTAEICVDCHIFTDSLGLIHRNTHRTKPYEDEVDVDGAVRKGIGFYIRANRLDLTDDVITILP